MVSALFNTKQLLPVILSGAVRLRTDRLWQRGGSEWTQRPLPGPAAKNISGLAGDAKPTVGKRDGFFHYECWVSSTIGIWSGISGGTLQKSADVLQ
jgi:hypothetical protein